MTASRTRRPLLVGLTGSIASGKSTVARRLKDSGIPVIDLDKVGHEVLRRRHEAFEPVVAAFGDGILGDDGEIDRKKLGAIVFADPLARARLNAIVHPKIRDEERRRTASMAEKRVDAIATEAALLIETGQRDRFDFFVVVGCDSATQVGRIRNRDGIGEAEARARMSAQLSFEEKRKFADWVIDTGGTMEATRAAADALVVEIRRRVSAR